MKTSYGKTIFVTAAITLVSLISCVVLFVGVMFALCPGRSGDFAYNVGYDGLASSLYYKEYTYSGDVARLYQALNVAIENGKYAKVIEYYEEFRNNEYYDKFVDYKIECAKNENVDTLVKAGLLNEREYLERNYVKALVKKGKEKKAFNFALNSFKADKIYTLDKTGIYALSYFTEDKYFDDVYVKEGVTLREGIELYVDELYRVFTNNQASNSSLDDAYLVSLGNKIVLVSEHINSMLDSGDARVSINNGYITNVNNVLQGILGN